MMRSNFEELRREKAYREKRSLPIAKIVEETGLAVNTITRFQRPNLEGIKIDTINTLCNYFGVKDINELIQFVPDEKPEEGSAANVNA